MKEAAARIKINKLLEAAGWRFFADANGPANIQLETHARLSIQALDALGENFEKTGKGFIDFLLLDSKGFPFIVLEAKSSATRSAIMRARSGTTFAAASTESGLGNEVMM
jgi:type I restriction enzyme R subunit